jgi:hypothetical protein
MGWNTTVVVLNDALGYIEEDPEFGKKLARAILGLSAPPDRQRCDVSARRPRGGVHANAATVVETHHADAVVTVDVGGNTAVVVGSRYDPKFPGPADQETHACHACGREHAGYEEKYCEICGKAAQERKTLYEALHIIEMCTREGKEDLKAARDYAIQALVVAPHGERLDVLDWRGVYEGKITIDEAYKKVASKVKKAVDAARRRKERERLERWDRQRKKADGEDE